MEKDNKINQYDRYTILILGETCCGKTAIKNRLVENKFSEKRIATFGKSKII